MWGNFGLDYVLFRNFLHVYHDIFAFDHFLKCEFGLNSKIKQCNCEKNNILKFDLLIFFFNKILQILFL